MWKNIWKSAWSGMKNDRLYAGINIVGLTIGLTACLFIVIYVQDELSYDRYHSQADRTFRLWEILELEGTGEHSSSMQFPVGPALLNDYPEEIEDVVRFFNFQRPVFTLKVEEIVFNQEGVFFADSGVFEMFDWPLLSGDPNTVFTQPNVIVLDEDLAEKYFGSEDPVGQQMLLEGGAQLMVGGVMKNVPSQSHFQPKALISFVTLANFLGPDMQSNNWVWNPCWTYVRVAPNTNLERLDASFEEFTRKYFPEFLKEQVDMNLMPLADIHLESHLEYEIRPNQERSYLFILIGIGVIILIIASVNFTNLSTARSVRRAREVGVRKVVGASRSQLIFQFVFETFLTVFVSMVVSLGLANLLLNSFNSIASKTLSFSALLDPQFLWAIVVLVVIVTLLAGAYPAFYLSSFRPTAVLKGGAVQVNAKVNVRKVLVLLQFALASAMIVGTLMVNRQFEFLRSEDPGFDEDKIVMMANRPALMPQFEAFRTEILRSPAVESFTVMNDIIGEDHNVFEYNYEGMNPEDWQYLPTLIVDEDFVPTMGLEIVAGRNFDREIQSDDTAGVLVNETLVREMGWGSPQDALGKRMDTPRGNERVIGVLKDFHYVGLTEPIRPFVLDMISGNGFWVQDLGIRIANGKESEAIAHLEEVWNEFAPAYPFEYFFLEERLDGLYKGQDVLRILVALFSFVAILISCIGLFALTSLSVTQRTKELGVRRVLGAEPPTIAWLIGKEILILILLAFVVGIPFAYWGVQDWLDGFAYRIPFAWMTVFTALSLSVLVAGISVLYQIIKVARMDPVHSLRYE